MRRIRLVVAYDGTNYHGWQYQPNAVTIEEVLNKALTELLREPIAVIGASRTDAGVHAQEPHGGGQDLSGGEPASARGYPGTKLRGGGDGLASQKAAVRQDL